MSVIKANYVKRGVGERRLAKDNIRYIQSRPGRDKERLTRTLFDKAGILGRLEAYQMIDEAVNGSLFYRLKLSPDPKTEDTKRDLDMQTLTRNTMQSLEDRLNVDIFWAAALHDDHSAVRHVHVLAAIPQKLNRQDLNFLISEATRMSQEMRRGLDQGQTATRLARTGECQYTQTPFKIPLQPAGQPPGRKTTRHRHRAGRGVKSHHQPAVFHAACTCPRCHFSQTHQHTHAHQCVSCGLILHRKREISLERRRRTEWTH